MDGAVGLTYADLVRTLICDPPPADFAELLERRRRLRLDRRDEVWDGVYRVNPTPAMAHSITCRQLALILDPLARSAGLVLSMEFNLGEQGDFRIPDLGLHRDPELGVWHATAALVVEVLSPEHEAALKLPFYAARGVEEVVIVDPARREGEWLALAGGEYVNVTRSRLLDVSADGLAALIEWPAQVSEAPG